MKALRCNLKDEKLQDENWMRNEMWKVERWKPWIKQKVTIKLTPVIRVPLIIIKLTSNSEEYYFTLTEWQTLNCTTTLPSTTTTLLSAILPDTKPQTSCFNTKDCFFFKLI